MPKWVGKEVEEAPVDAVEQVKRRVDVEYLRPAMHVIGRQKA